MHRITKSKYLFCSFSHDTVKTFLLQQHCSPGAYNLKQSTLNVDPVIKALYQKQILYFQMYLLKAAAGEGRIKIKWHESVPPAPTQSGSLWLEPKTSASQPEREFQTLLQRSSKDTFISNLLGETEDCLSVAMRVQCFSSIDQKQHLKPCNCGWYWVALYPLLWTFQWDNGLRSPPSLLTLIGMAPLCDNVHCIKRARGN